MGQKGLRFDAPLFEDLLDELTVKTLGSRIKLSENVLIEGFQKSCPLFLGFSTFQTGKLCLDDLSDLLLDLLELLLAPRQLLLLVALELLENFSVYFRVSLMAGIIIAMPLVVYQLLAFLAPALTGKERRFIFSWIPFIVVMFIASLKATLAPDRMGTPEAPFTGTTEFTVGGVTSGSGAASSKMTSTQ
jgi:hypothetical protein